MADKNVSLEATDIFSLGGSFVPQSSSITHNVEYATMIAANGDWEKWSDVFNGIDNITATYKYNSDTGLGAALPCIGEVLNGYMLTEISVSSVYNDYPSVSITAHQHDENSHTTGNQYCVAADVQAIITGHFGAYDYSEYATGDICVTDSVYTLTMEHLDAACSDGDHWVGANLRGKETVSITLIGHITDFPATIAGWTVTGTTLNDSNADFDTTNIAAERIVERE